MKHLLLVLALLFSTNAFATSNQDHTCQGGHNCNTTSQGGHNEQDQTQGQVQGQTQSAEANANALSLSSANASVSSENTNLNLNDNTNIATGGSAYATGGAGGEGGSAVQGQSQSSDNSNSSNNSASQNINIAGDKNVGSYENSHGNNVSAYAPAIYSSSACTAGGLSGSASAFGMGVALGGAKQDPSCVIRENARILSGLDTNLAIEYLCRNPGVDVGQVLGALCKPAPVVAPPIVIPEPEPEVPVQVITEPVKG